MSLLYVSSSIYDSQFTLKRGLVLWQQVWCTNFAVRARTQVPSCTFRVTVNMFGFTMYTRWQCYESFGWCNIVRIPCLEQTLFIHFCKCDTACSACDTFPAFYTYRLFGRVKSKVAVVRQRFYSIALEGCVLSQLAVVECFLIKMWYCEIYIRRCDMRKSCIQVVVVCARERWPMVLDPHTIIRSTLSRGPHTVNAAHPTLRTTLRRTDGLPWR